MITIHKYKVAGKDEQTIQMPMYAEPVHVGLQDGNIHIWAKVDTELSLVPVTIKIAGTGHDITQFFFTYNHIGTIMVGYYVFHVFFPKQQ